MHHCKLLLSTLLLGLAAKDVLAVTIPVVVGGPGLLQYDPPFVNASLNDVVRFIFKQKNHTVTQSTFENPCTYAGGDAFDTGFVPVADSVTANFPVAEVTVRSMDPIWVFCKQANHCQQGMVFSVNPGDQFAAFKAAAMGNANTNTAPPPPATTVIPPPTSSGFITVTGSPMTTTYTTNSASTTPGSVTGTDHKVIVGGPGVLAFSPSNISAQIGDTVTFEFHQKNHTVTASSFDTPCRPLSSTSTTEQLGFDSGFIAVADDTTQFPTFTVRVNDTNPIWGYCRQANHCGQGMVFSINSVESSPKTFSAFQTLAKQQNGTSTPAGSGALAASPGSHPVMIFTAVASLLFFFLK